MSTKRSAIDPATIGSGLLSPLLYYVLTLTEMPLALLTIFCSLPLYLIGLHRGIKPVIVSTCASVIGILLLKVAFDAKISHYLISHCLPAFCIVFFSLLSRADSGKKGKQHWYPSGQLIGWATLCGALSMVLSMLELFNFQGTVNADLTMLINRTPLGFPLSQEQITQLIFFVPSFAGLGIMVTIVLNFRLALFILKPRGLALRSQFDFLWSELPLVIYFILGSSALLCFVTSGFWYILVKNALVLLLAPFLVIGYCIIRLWVKDAQLKPFQWILFYLLCYILVMLVFPLFLIIVLGALEPWIQIRNRYFKKES